jgi:glutamate formiminotransferase
MGVPLVTRNLVQVSMNLTDFEQTPLRRVFDSVSQEAAARGVSLAGTQIVGLIPRQAALGCDFVPPNQILENALNNPRT